MFNTINRAFANTPDLDSAPAVLPTTFSAKLTSQELCGLENAKHFCKWVLSCLLLSTRACPARGHLIHIKGEDHCTRPQISLPNVYEKYMYDFATDF